MNDNDTKKDTVIYVVEVAIIKWPKHNTLAAYLFRGGLLRLNRFSIIKLFDEMVYLRLMDPVMFLPSFPRMMRMLFLFFR